MIRCDFHTHTVFSDGADTPEEMVLAAIHLGMEAIGFSEHSWTPFDPAPCMRPEKQAEYRKTVQQLKEKYRGNIRILTGLEQDYDSPAPAEGFDYVIGSVHYVCCRGTYIAVDDTPEILRQGISDCYGGDVYALAEDYWKAVSDVVHKTNADIIGHLDLIRKFNKENSFFDEQNPRYRDAAFAAIDTLLKTGKPFEINTGAISRGYQSLPYPSPMLMDYIRRHGGHFILSSDSHSRKTLCYGFDDYAAWADTTL